MDNAFITGKLKTRFTDGIISTDETSDMLTVVVSKEVIHDVIFFLKENQSLGFTFLTTLCGIHYPEQKLPLGVVYHLHRFEGNEKIRIKTFLPLKNPVIPTVTDLFSAADWMERETYDFYGIIFEGHPNLKRILNVEYMDYFPMRKEYPLEDQTRHDKDDRFFGR
ncbi:MAG: NADH-quinone oxidoreductase subunit C [Bacteroidetes bacterium]|nr:NADH-quinone oxidoreductase subunit C [Bacteroidota bacterium]